MRTALIFICLCIAGCGDSPNLRHAETPAATAAGYPLLVPLGTLDPASVDDTAVTGAADLRRRADALRNL